MSQTTLAWAFRIAATLLPVTHTHAVGKEEWARNYLRHAAIRFRTEPFTIERFVHIRLNARRGGIRNVTRALHVNIIQMLETRKIARSVLRRCSGIRATQNRFATVGRIRYQWADQNVMVWQDDRPHISAHPDFLEMGICHQFRSKIALFKVEIWAFAS